MGEGGGRSSGNAVDLAIAASQADANQDVANKRAQLFAHIADMGPTIANLAALVTKSTAGAASGTIAVGAAGAAGAAGVDIPYPRFGGAALDDSAPKAHNPHFREG